MAAVREKIDPSDGPGLVVDAVQKMHEDIKNIDTYRRYESSYMTFVGMSKRWAAENAKLYDVSPPSVDVAREWKEMFQKNMKKPDGDLPYSSGASSAAGEYQRVRRWVQRLIRAIDVYIRN